MKRAREHLADEAQANGIELRQSDARIGLGADEQAGRYVHAKQCRRMRGQLRRLRSWLGHVIRDVERKTAGTTLTVALAHKIAVARRLHAQRREDSNKLYALHASDV